MRKIIVTLLMSILISISSQSAMAACAWPGGSAYNSNGLIYVSMVRNLTNSNVIVMMDTNDIIYKYTYDLSETGDMPSSAQSVLSQLLVALTTGRGIKVLYCDTGTVNQKNFYEVVNY